MQPSVYTLFITFMIKSLRAILAQERDRHASATPFITRRRRVTTLLPYSLLVAFAGSVTVLQAQTLPCNYRTLTTNNFSTATIVNARTGGVGGFLGIGAGSVANTGNVIDADLNNSGSINTVLGIGSGGQISVGTSNATVFGAGAIAGFVVGNASGLGANLLPSTTITTYLNGVQQETSASSSLLDLALLSGAGQRTLGFMTTKNFDEVQIRISSIVSLLTNLPVYYPFVQYKNLSATASATNASTSLSTDGTVNLVVDGGRAPFTYAWSNGATTQNLTNVRAGTYTVTVTDANGCTTTTSAVVGFLSLGCNAGSTAPALSAIAKANTCPATTVNLTTLTASNTPANAVLEYHTATPATAANKVNNPASVTAGTYYAVFYDATNNCYSNASGSAGATTITATTVACCAAGNTPPTFKP